jgi:uncharacterized membrane protein YbhN (UPF0104 family)
VTTIPGEREVTAVQDRTFRALSAARSPLACAERGADRPESTKRAIKVEADLSAPPAHEDRRLRAPTAVETALSAPDQRSSHAQSTKRAILGLLQRSASLLGHRHVRTFLAIALLAVVVWRLGAGPFLDGIRSVDLPAVGAALAIGLATTVLSAWRWVVVARRLGMPLRVRPAIGDCYQALFLNSVLPAGVLGDVGRAVAHGREVGDVGRSARAVMIEKAAGQVVLVVVGTAVLVAQPAVLRVLGIPPQVWGPLVGLAALGAAAALFVPRLRAAVATLFSDVRRAAGASLAVGGLSLLALAGYLGMFLVAARTAGATAPVAELLPLLVLALFVMGLPVNVGGFGPREATAALAFGAVGLGAAQGLTTAVVYGVLAMVSTLPGALVLLARRFRA